MGQETVYKAVTVDPFVKWLPGYTWGRRLYTRL